MPSSALCFRSATFAYRQDPKMIRCLLSDAPPLVRMTLGGNGCAAGGQTCSPSTSTVYGVLESGSSPVTGTSA